MKVSVSLRQKLISKGRNSLYLDFYPPIPHPETGKPTRREFLKLYLIEKPKTPFDRQKNKEIFELAQQIQHKRTTSLNKPEIYSEYEKEKLRYKELGEQDFIDYFKSIAEKRTGSNYSSWISAINYFETFTGGSLKFADVNEMLLNEFKEYLLSTQSKRSKKTKLSQNTASSYFNKLKATLKQAFKDGILRTDLNHRIEPIKEAETRREFLTLEELNSLVKTPCNDPLLKRAALFSALTGLRFSDIQKLIWEELSYVNNQGFYIRYQQKKTDSIESLPISEQAYKLLGDPGKPEEKVFKELRYSAYKNKHLYQ